jgi:hypothetical protein
MDRKTGCLVCGSPLVYTAPETRTCHYCRTVQQSNAACQEGHFICDACHSASANDLIQRVCSATDSKEPLALAISLMRDPRIKMHGPEHHYLVPAVLLAAWSNTTGQPEATRAQWVSKARGRAEEVKGGSCGFNGACGAGIGTGICVSVGLGATPLSVSEWRLANLLTSRSLGAIAENGGPRCCKRDTFLAIEQAKAFLEQEKGVAFPAEESPRCEFSPLNKECIAEACPYFAGA